MNKSTAPSPLNDPYLMQGNSKDRREAVDEKTSIVANDIHVIVDRGAISALPTFSCHAY